MCDQQDPRFGGVAELMACTGWKERAVRSSIAGGTIPAVRVGRSWSIPIRSYLASLEHGNAPDADDIEGAEDIFSDQEEVLA